MNNEKIRATVDAFFTKVFNEGNADLLSELVSGEYIQHNPLFPDGTDALAGYLKQVGSIPNEVKRVAIEGDLAFIHVRYPNLNGIEYAAVDIFRFDDDGKILEHWDVLQPVPTESANNNTMF